MILTEQQQLLRDAAREFAREQLAPFAAEWDRDAKFPGAAIRALGELGFFGVLVPEVWGGVGASHLEYALVLEELAAGDASCTTVISVQTLVNGILNQYGTEAQKERYLRGLAAGTTLSAFALTEPQAGSDAANLKTRATREGEGWRLNGTKQFISNAAHADVMLVFTSTTPELGARGITAFLVDPASDGLQIARTEKKMGQRASEICQLVFDHVYVSDDMRVGDVDRGYRIALSNLECGRIGIASQSIGMAQAAYQCALDYAQERESFGKPIIQHQAVGFRLADMATRIEAARQLTWHAATLRDAGLPCLKEASMAKLFASEMAEQVCSDAIQTLGGYGYLQDFPVERIYRDVRINKIYEGTSDVQRMLISRQIASG